MMRLRKEILLLAEEIQLLACGYSAQCTVRGCRARATMLARCTDNQGRPLRQRELCDRHADWLKANRPNVTRFEGADGEKAKSRQQDTRNAAFALDQDTVLVIVAKLVDALSRAIPKSHASHRKNEALRLGRELLRGTKYEEPVIGRRLVSEKRAERNCLGGEPPRPRSAPEAMRSSPSPAKRTLSLTHSLGQTETRTLAP
jgi:hypothetical protein